jgi:hypothetical protein
MSKTLFVHWRNNGFWAHDVGAAVFLKHLLDAATFARGEPFITTSSAIRLGDAVIQLVNGTLPEPPPGTYWFFATEASGITLGKRSV